MKKKLLIISPYLPYPLSHGGAVAQYFFLENLNSLYDISFLCEINSTQEKNDGQYLIKCFPKITFLFFENYTVSKVEKHESLWIRFKVIIHKLLSGWKLLPTSMMAKELYSIPFNENFGKFITEQFIDNNFDIVQLEFFGILPYVDFIPKNIYSIFIHHEIKFKALSLREKKDVDLIANIKKYEIEKLKSFSRVAVFNEHDREILNREGLSHIYISHFGLPLSYHLKRDVSLIFNKFIFLGSQNHYANVEGLQLFIEQIYLQNYNMLVPFYITGYWSEDFKRQYKDFKKIIFVGFVEDLEKLFENGVLLCPINSGGGIRTKIIQAFVNKVPVFSTEMGAEGLLKGDGHIVVYDDKTFIKKYKLYFNDASLLDIAIQGNNYYNKFFNNNVLIQERINLYNN